MAGFGDAWLETMNDPIDKALWFIENNLGSELSLEAIASAAGVSRFVLSRQFAWSTDLSVMRYVRARRLSLSVHALTAGSEDILTVAIGAGYASHEAFSRAFRDHFGRTPEDVRKNGAASLTLTEPKRMKTQTADLSQPRFERSKPLLIAGLSARYKLRRRCRHTSAMARLCPEHRDDFRRGSRRHLRRDCEFR